jgi:hypothetical protein
MESETAKSYRPKKFIHGIIFNEDGDMLLCISNATIRLPGGLVYWADICQFPDERWIPDFLSRRIEIDTHIPASETKRRIQRLPATYNVYPFSFKEEHSVIIVGQIDSSWVTIENAEFLSIDEVLGPAEGYQVEEHQKMLIVRGFASRDCPNSYHRKLAGEWLKSRT